jgi:hypothetical protein
MVSEDSSEEALSQRGGFIEGGPKPGAAVDEAPSTEKEPPSDVEEDQHGQKRVRISGQ